jgi:hypothetical protein
MIDKIMSLNLGRAPSFPDYDIDVEAFTLNQDQRFCAWDKVLVAFVELCKLQGQIYDELYSARARRQLPEIRSKIIEERASSLSAWYVGLKKVCSAIPVQPRKVFDSDRLIREVHKTTMTWISSSAGPISSITTF